MEKARDRLFEFGNHTFTHAAFHTPCYRLPRAQDKRAEISGTQEILRRLTGRAPALFSSREDAAPDDVAFR